VSPEQLVVKAAQASPPEVGWQSAVLVSRETTAEVLWTLFDQPKVASDPPNRFVDDSTGL
jgi:hypothetical protein